MVRYKSILDVIEGYVVKCLTIAQMRERLANLTFDEQFEQLKSQGLLNPMEIKDFEEQMKTYESLSKEDYEKIVNSENLRDLLSNTIEKHDTAEKVLFQYGRRLFEGIPHNEPPLVDRNSFGEDPQYDNMDYLKTEESTGEMEMEQISNQEKLLGDGAISDDLWRSVHCYYGGSIHPIEKRIRDGMYLKELRKEDRRTIKDIDYVIEQTGGLTQDTVLYMGGHLDDIHLNVGDHGKFKRHMSTSYQRFTAELFQHKNVRPNNFLYKIYAPQGTKGLCGNAKECFGHWDIYDEHEYTLPRNIGYTVLDIDYDNNTVEILLDEPQY